VSEHALQAQRLREIDDLLAECQRHGMPGIMVSYAQLRALRSEVERLTAERNRYKAWHDDVASRRLHVLQENGRVYDAIVRPQPLKENE